MKILLVSASQLEIEGAIKSLENPKNMGKGIFRGFEGSNLIDILITGVGAAITTEKLSSHLVNSRYDLVLNVGICGSFRKEYEIGTVVNVSRETWGDLGSEDHEDFLDLFDLDLIKPDEDIYSGKDLVNNGNAYSLYFQHFPKVKGITVNKCHGNEKSIENCVRKYNPDIESMESAAIFIVCKSRGINFQCLRSISNFVSPRNKAEWDIEKALEGLSVEIKKILSVIKK